MGLQDNGTVLIEYTTQDLVDDLEHEHICPDEPVIIRILFNQMRSCQDITEFRVYPDAGGTVIELVMDILNSPKS